MKLTYFQLEAHLAKQLAPVYIVSGEELLLKQDSIQWIRKAAKRSGVTEKLRLNQDESRDEEALYTSLNANSLLAEKRLLELDFRSTFPTKTISKLLQEYASHHSVDTILLLDTGKIDAKVAKSAWYTALDHIGITVTIWPIAREQLPKWIMERAKKYKLTLASDAANLLADYVEGNLTAAAQALEKIYLLKPTESINASLIETLLTDESQYTIFDFVESLISENRSRSLHILENLKNEGTEPTLILWGITRELRMLAEIAAQLKQGQSLASLMQKQRIFAKRERAIRQFLTKHSVADCLTFLKHAAVLDKMIKGALPYSPWEALQLFCLRMV